MDNTLLISNLSQFIAIKILKQANRQISASEPLISSGLVDSFNLIDLALYIEDTYGAHLDDTELNRETFDTLEELSALVQQRQQS